MNTLNQELIARPQSALDAAWAAAWAAGDAAWDARVAARVASGAAGAGALACMTERLFRYLRGGAWVS